MNIHITHGAGIGAPVRTAAPGPIGVLVGLITAARRTLLNGPLSGTGCLSERRPARAGPAGPLSAHGLARPRLSAASASGSVTRALSLALASPSPSRAVGLGVRLGVGSRARVAGGTHSPQGGRIHWIYHNYQ